MEKAKKSNNYHYNKKLQTWARENKKTMTKSAACMWKYVLSNKQMLGYQFRRERPILDFIVDFVCLELLLVIEVDGITHQTEEAKVRDFRRDEKLREVGFSILRFSSWEVLNRISDVSNSILEFIRLNSKELPKGNRRRKSKNVNNDASAPPPDPLKGDKWGKARISVISSMRYQKKQKMNEFAHFHTHPANLNQMKKIFTILLILHVAFFQIATAQSQVTKPNVLLIFTDQQNIEMMSAMGNTNLSTPNMDRLAKRGVMFTNAYCTSPVCGPARSSIISGRMPHETGVEWNGDSMRLDVKNVGQLFRGEGYETVWAGKWHLPESYPQRAESKQKEIIGFDLLPFRDPEIENWMLGAETDPPLTKAVVKYLNDYENDQPFFLAVSYHNPHDICFYSRKDGWVTEEDSLLDIRYYGFEYQLPDVVGTHPSEFESLPALPDNFAVDENEPEFILDKRKWGYHMEYGLETHLAYNEFDSLEWRGYLNAYYRLTEMVDLEIGKVLDALANNGLSENTIIAFTSDHGDGAAGHQWSTKNSLYKESAMVPMIISYPGMIPGDRIDSTHLVTQIDITPTLCDLAGIRSPDGFTGESMKDILTEPGAKWREYVVVELADYKPDRSRKGRMVRSEKYKYNVYTAGARNEQLFDLDADPGESINLASESEYKNVLQNHRTFLQQWMIKTNDSFEIPK